MNAEQFFERLHDLFVKTLDGQAKTHHLLHSLIERLDRIMADAFDPIRKALADSQTSSTASQALISAVNGFLPDVQALVNALKAAPAGTIPQDVLDQATAVDQAAQSATTALGTATQAVSDADASTKAALPIVPAPTA